MHCENCLCARRDRGFDPRRVDVDVRASTSTNTGVAPRMTIALAVDTKVKDGMITLVAGGEVDRIAAISNAAVQLWVINALGERSDALDRGIALLGIMAVA